MYYLNNFLFFSILGHIFESILFLVLDNNGYSGIFFGPWTPVYGLGIIIIIYAIFLSLIEYIGGISIEIFFHKIFWNYSNHKFNLGYYVSLEMALLWGLVSCIYLFVFKKIIDIFIKKIPVFISIPVFIIFISDFVVTLITKLVI